MRAPGISGLLVLFTACVSAGAVPKTADPSAEQSRAIELYHQRLTATKGGVAPKTNIARPFSDLETAGYLFFSADTQFNSLKAKRTMAKELPQGVTLVIYADPSDDIQSIRDQYRGVIDPQRLKIVKIPDSGSGFWSRDGLPVPVWNVSGQMEVVDAQYYHGFEPDKLVAKWFSAPLLKHKYFYEGGNFMANDDGDCVMVDNSRAKSIPLDIFERHYGCRRTIRLPYEKGIGHVDESVRFVSRHTVLTDTASYARILREAGFVVVELPRPAGYYETYINSLIVNGTAFVPVFGESTDAVALEAYEAAGLKVVPIETRSLANDGHGSLHCITMTYPPVPFASLLKSLMGR